MTKYDEFKAQVRRLQEQVRALLLDAAGDFRVVDVHERPAQTPGWSVQEITIVSLCARELSITIRREIPSR